MKLGAILVGVVLATSGCEKSGDVGGSSSGAAKNDEKALMQYLPQDAMVMFGGDYMRLQKNLTLGKFAQTMEQSAPGMTAWMDCWISLKDVRMLGAGSLDMTSGAGMRMQFVMTGASIADLEACAKKANFAATIDPDKKFISLAMPSALGPMKTGYLQTPSGAIYTRMAMPLGGKPEPSDRAMLEADLAKLAGNTLDKNVVLTGAMAKVDRTRPVWFVGTAANTPAADKVGLVMATVDLTNGLALDLSAELKDGALADQITQGLAQAKKSADQMPNGMGEIVKNIDMSRDGNTVRAKVSLDKKQFEMMMDQFGQQLGALGGAGR